MICPFKFFKGCLPQILHGQFLNTLSHLTYNVYLQYNSDTENISV